MIKYEFPCYPGDEVWFIEMYAGKPLCMVHDRVQMVGFTTRSVQIKPRSHHNLIRLILGAKTSLLPRKSVRQNTKSLRKKQERLEDDKRRKI